MKYTIYEMIQPSHLKEIEPDGYYQKTIYRDVLQKLDVSGVEEEHPTMECAIAEIHNKKDLLKNLQLTIIPVLSISWNCEVS
jgi:hypothetical protein